MFEIKVVGFKTFIYYVTYCNPATDWSRGPPASSIMAILSLPAVKRPGHGANHPLSSSSEVTNGLELHFASSLCSHRYFTGLPFTVIHFMEHGKVQFGPRVRWRSYPCLSQIFWYQILPISVHTVSGGPSSLLYNGCWSSIKRVNRLRHKCTHSPAWTAKVKKWWSPLYRP
jgi:hypothetical protein